MLSSRELRSMQEDYRIHVPFNVTFLTRRRARVARQSNRRLFAARDRQLAGGRNRRRRRDFAALWNFGRCRSMADIGQAAPIRLD
jgi:hypothetical protein